jgi:hypothetical protein
LALRRARDQRVERAAGGAATIAHLGGERGEVGLLGGGRVVGVVERDDLDLAGDGATATVERRGGARPDEGLLAGGGQPPRARADQRDLEDRGGVVRGGGAGRAGAGPEARGEHQ